MGKRLIKHLVTILLVYALIFTPIMIVPAAVGSDGSDQSDLIISLLEQLADDIFNTTELPFEAFEHKNLGSVEGKRRALVNKIGAVINQIESGAYEGALDKLKNDIQKKIIEWLEGRWETDLFKRVNDIIHLIKGVPIASFTFAPIPPIASETVTFNASSSYDVNGYIVSYTWDFGDDNITSVPSPIITHIYATYGTYKVKLTVTDNDNLTDTESKDVKVIAPPTASFTYSPLAPLVGDFVTFDASSSTPNGGNIISYEWDFGDNSPIVYGEIVMHIYGKAGTYEVVLNVTDTEGLWDLATATIKVSAVPPLPDFSISASRTSLTIQQGSSDSLTITVNSLNDFNQPVDLAVTPALIDGVTSILSTLQVTPPPNGSVTSVLTISVDTTATTGTYLLTVTGTSGMLIHSVNIALGIAALPPVADANGPYSGYEGSPITFNASGSTPDGGEIVLYEWDWDNDGIYDDNTTSPFINHTWPDDFTGTVVLRVTDDDGLTNVDTTSVTVHNVAPSVEAGPDREADEGSPVSFSGNFTDSGSDTHTIHWDFGDGGFSDGTLTPTHVYTDNGVYTVTLNVTDDDGGFGMDTIIVTVNNVAPTAEAGGNQTVNVEETVYFNGSATDPGLDTFTYEWDFGDETNATGQNVTHVYTERGNYTVTLTVTDDDGGVDTDELTVTVLEVTVYEFPWALYAAVGLGIAALIATAFYLWYRRRKKRASAGPSRPQTKPVVTLYVPSGILAGYEEER